MKRTTRTYLDCCQPPVLVVIPAKGDWKVTCPKCGQITECTTFPPKKRRA